MLPFHGHSLHPRELIFGMSDPQGCHCVFHYSDIRISDFGFFRIFALYCHNFDPLVLNFGMWRPEHLALNFNYPDFRISGFGCSDFFRIFDNFFGFRIFFIFSLSLTVSEANYVDIGNHCRQRAKRATYISSSVLAPSPRPKGEQGRRRRSRVFYKMFERKSCRSSLREKRRARWCSR